MTGRTLVAGVTLVLSALWLAGQVYVVFYPQYPVLQRAVHLTFALVLTILATSVLSDGRRTGRVAAALDGALVCAALAVGVYYVAFYERLTERMQLVDPIFWYDIGAGVLAIAILLECVRRVVGWTLLAVVLFFLAYAFFGDWFPAWLRFQAFALPDFIEFTTMGGDGILGLTTSASLLIVFYFVVFGAVYSAIGGGQLFIDIGMRIARHQRGAAAKAAVLSSSLMGSISGNAISNVVTTGVFTIPLMRESGLKADRAAATEAIASTGGQLMPPIMGIAAFVMAEMLRVPYVDIALAGIIPAVAFYAALLLVVDLYARKRGIGTAADLSHVQTASVLARFHLFVPPVVLVWLMVSGSSPGYAALWASLACVAVNLLRPEGRLTLAGWRDALLDGVRQAAQVAIPIAAVGIIIAVSVQSNLALKFSTRLMEISGGTLVGAMAFIILGCLVMGMGLPTVPAYIIGAIMFAPALVKLGVPELAAHFFVMYYAVLSMVTPPVALSAYAAAGLAKSNAMTTGFIAFRMGLVAFFIPIAFAFDPALLGQGEPAWIAFAFASLMVGTMAWGVALEGYLGRLLRSVERALFAALAAAIILSPTGTLPWAAGLAGALGLAGWCFFTSRATRGADGGPAMPAPATERPDDPSRTGEAGHSKETAT